MVRAHFRKASSTFSPVSALVSRNISSGGAGRLSVPTLYSSSGFLKGSTPACPHLRHCRHYPLRGMVSSYLHTHPPLPFRLSSHGPSPEPSLMTQPESKSLLGLPCAGSDFSLMSLSPPWRLGLPPCLYHCTMNLVSLISVPRLIEHSPKPPSATQRSHDRASQ